MDPVELFLRETKRLLREDKYHFLEREKNKRTLIKLGWTIDMVVDFIITELTPEDIYRSNVEIGDSKLKEKFGELFAYEFKRNIPEQDLELFIRIAKVYGEELIVIISFHESER